MWAGNPRLAALGYGLPAVRGASGVVRPAGRRISLVQGAAVSPAVELLLSEGSLHGVVLPVESSDKGARLRRVLLRWFGGPLPEPCEIF